LELAQKLQAEEEQRQKLKEKQEKRDAAMAASIKSVEDEELDKRKKKELDSMKGSMTGHSVFDHPSSFKYRRPPKVTCHWYHYKYLFEYY
jgi:hypothetical protein